MCAGTRAALRKAWGAALACAALLPFAPPAHAGDRAALERPSGEPLTPILSSVDRCVGDAADDAPGGC